MRSRRQPYTPVHWFLGMLTLAICMIGGIMGLMYLGSYFWDQPSDPHFICNYPGYKRLHEGMSAAAVKRVLGEPTSTNVNGKARVLAPATIVRLQAQERQLIREADIIDKALNQSDPRPAGPLENQLKHNLVRCQEQREEVHRALAVLVKEVWTYFVPGWHGHIEICIDVFGRVSGISGGYA